jgi:tetraacyldisaccharide 4'-kinase
MVFVARKRRLGVQAAEERGAEVIILDDGFQHLAVHRDLNIVLLDARAPFGNGQMLPAGRLREPVSTLDQSSLIVMTHAESDTKVVLPVDRPVVRCCHRLSEHLVSLEGEQCSRDLLHGKNILAFAGIAQPENFFTALRKSDVTLEKTLALSDHQGYGADMLNRLRDACHNCDLLVTTEKDAVKLNPATLSRPCYGVPMELDIIDGQALEPALETIRKRIRNEFE